MIGGVKMAENRNDRFNWKPGDVTITLPKKTAKTSKPSKATANKKKK